MTIQKIAEEVLGSRKYSAVDRAIVERICEESISKYAKPKDIIKAVKKELHIIHGAFLVENCHIKAEALLDAYSGGDIKTDRVLAAKLMALHISTRERLGEADEIYSFLSAFIDPGDGIIDIGCGFNPFALPFFTVLPKNYCALDMNLSTISLLAKYFALAKLPYRSELFDAASQALGAPGDLVFLLKLFPLLERQKKGCGFAILDALDFRTAFVSFPLKSASGKEKGMEVFYSSSFEAELPEGLTIVEKAKFNNEMVYVLGKLSQKLIRSFRREGISRS